MLPLPGHDERAWQVAWNPTKPLIASCSADKTVRLYSYRRNSNDPTASVSFSHVTTISTPHTKTVRTVAWAPSGKTLATGSFDSNVGVYETKDESDDDVDLSETREWECVTLLEGHETECKSVVYSGNGTLLASCSRDKTVWIWGGEIGRLCSAHRPHVCSLVQPDSDFECMSVLMEHTQDVKCIAWHPKEEVRMISLFTTVDADNFLWSRSLHQLLTMTRSSFTLKIHQMTGTASRH